MTAASLEKLPLRNSGDILLVRQKVRSRSIELGFSLVDQTKMVTAASELARNTVDYGGGGIALFETVNDGPRRGLRVTFEDQGPGIQDIQLALKDGWTSGGGLGLGLGGAKRLVNDFQIESKVGQGTKVVVTRWK